MVSLLVSVCRLNVYRFFRLAHKNNLLGYALLEEKTSYFIDLSLLLTSKLSEIFHMFFLIWMGNRSCKKLNGNFNCPDN